MKCNMYIMRKFDGKFSACKKSAKHIIYATAKRDNHLYKTLFCSSCFALNKHYWNTDVYSNVIHGCPYAIL